MFNKLKKWWYGPTLAYHEEILVAYNYIIKKKFASLSDENQYKGYLLLSEMLATYSMHLKAEGQK
jgi:hypothetical protein